MKWSHRLLRPLLAAALVPLSLLAPAAAGASTGDASDNGLWYYTATGLEQLHQRSTGDGIKVAVIDLGLIPGAPDLVGADAADDEADYCAQSGGSAAAETSPANDRQHGTHIAALLVGTGAGLNGEPGTRGVAPGAEVEVFGLGDGEQTCSPEDFSRAFRDAATSGAQIINVSGRFALTGDDMLVALREGVIVVASAGNEGVVDGLPAMFNGVVTVGTLDPDLTLAEGSPVSGGVDVVAPGGDIRTITADMQGYATSTGSSNAAAFTSGALALTWSHYPDATANQILQSLVRNTGGTEHEPAIENVALGYGVVNVRQMLDSDPRSYPDANPFISEDDRAFPSISAIREALGEPAPSTSPAPTAEEVRATPTPETRPRPAETSSTSWVLLGGVGFLGAAVVVGFVLRRRARGDASKLP
jgi:hypothetical protein